MNIKQIFRHKPPLQLLVAAFVCSLLLIVAALSFAKEGELRITAPSDTVNGSFPVQARFHALARHSDFHVRTLIDGRVIDARVAKAIEPGDADRAWNFSSGINGGDSFDASLLTPGKHTVSVIAASGTKFGSGTNIDTVSKQFTVRDTKSIAATDETSRIGIERLPYDAGTNPRAYHTQSLLSYLQPLLGVQTASAASRHGDLDVIAEVAGSGERVPGVSVRIWHDPNIGGCDNGETHATDGNGAASFRGCVVSNSGGSDATYHVEVSNTPEGFMLADVAQKDVHIIWKQNRDIHFLYQRKAQQVPVDSPPAQSGSGQAPAPTTPAPLDYTYNPDTKPFVSITKLARASLEVDTFSVALNQSGERTGMPVKLDLYVDGVNVDTRQTESDNPTHHGITMSLGETLSEDRNHTVTVAATSANGKTSRATIEVVKTDTQNGTTGSTSDPASAGKAKYTGSLKVTTYVNQFNGGTTKDRHLGKVEISTENVGVARQCPTEKRTTDSSGETTFKECPLADRDDDNHAKMYEVTARVPKGYRVDSSFAGTEGVTVNGETVSRRVKLHKNQQTEVGFVFDATAMVTVQVVERVTDAEPPRLPEYLHWYETNDSSDLGNIPMGGIKVSVTPVGGSDHCQQTAQETNNNFDSDDYGTVKFTECPVTYSGDIRQFDIAIELPDGFSARPGEKTKRVGVSRTGNNSVVLILDRTGD